MQVLTDPAFFCIEPLLRCRNHSVPKGKPCPKGPGSGPEWYCPDEASPSDYATDDSAPSDALATFRRWRMRPVERLLCRFRKCLSPMSQSPRSPSTVGPQWPCESISDHDCVVAARGDGLERPLRPCRTARHSAFMRCIAKQALCEAAVNCTPRHSRARREGHRDVALMDAHLSTRDVTRNILTCAPSHLRVRHEGH